MSIGFIPLNSGYKKLKSYQKSVIIYDGTIYFCGRFYRNNRRQTDQMEQAARSGKQNIAEGSMASATSKQTEIHLTNVARASLGELMEDYEDFLRINHLLIWDKNHPTAVKITELSRHSEEIHETYRPYIENESPEVSANTIRHLILQAMFMLNKQLQRLEQDFLKDGGIRERMTNARIEYRATSSSQSPLSSMPSSCTTLCPLCNSPMKQRIARKGTNAGKSFWGCSKYPDCIGTREIGTDDKK